MRWLEGEQSINSLGASSKWRQITTHHEPIRLLFPRVATRQPIAPLDCSCRKNGGGQSAAFDGIEPGRFVRTRVSRARSEAFVVLVLRPAVDGVTLPGNRLPWPSRTIFQIACFCFRRKMFVGALSWETTAGEYCDPRCFCRALSKVLGRDVSCSV